MISGYIYRFLPRSRTFITLVLFLISLTSANAATVYITANTNWSSITAGCTGGVPCAGDTVIVKNAANLTVDVNNAECASLKLGDAAAAPKGNGILTFATAADALTVHGIVTFGDNITAPTRSGTLDMTAGGTLTCDGFAVVSIGTVTPGSGTVILDATNTFPANAKLGTYNNLIINNGTTTLGRALVVNADLTIRGTLDVAVGSNFRVDVKGNWNNSGGTFVEQNGTVRFLGTAAQSINGETFYNLTINNTGGDVSLTNNTTVKNTLTLTNGDVILGSNNLIIDVNGTDAGYSATSYVQADGTGVMIKNFNATGTFVFPIGDASNYSRFSITLNSATFGGGDYISARVTPSMHPKLNGTGDYIKRYWTINSGGFTAINYNVSYWYADADIIGTEANMKQQTWDGGIWTSYGAVVPASNRVNGSNITVIPSSFDFPASGDSSTLPVELLKFEAKFENGVVNIMWATASETNNDYFTVERSMDGINFETLTTVPGAGNSNHPISYTAVDKNPWLVGVSYYRLRQTDFDGKNEVFEPVAVQYGTSTTDSDAKLKAFPNPSNGQDLSIELSGYYPNTNVYVVVNDLLGREVYSDTITTNDIGVATTKIGKQLPVGTYIVAGVANGNLYTQKLIVR